jgi:integrase
MSRQTVQNGSKEYIEGGWWKFRTQVYVAGQDKRIPINFRLCPSEGPGALNKYQREALKRTLIAEHILKYAEALASESTVTVEQQGKILLDSLSRRSRRPVTAGCLRQYDCAMRLHINPIIGNYPVSAIFNPQLKLVIDSLMNKGYAASTINFTITVAKAIIGSAVDSRTGVALYLRHVNTHLIDLPLRDPNTQNTPMFSHEILTGLAAYSEPRFRMLFVLAGATGARIGELLGIEIDKHISPDFRTITIDQQATNGSKAVQQLITRVGRREVDLHPDIAAALKAFVGNSKIGLLFRTGNDTPLSPGVVRHHLHRALKQLGYSNAMAKNELAGTYALRRSREGYLRNVTACPEGIYMYWLGRVRGAEMSGYYDNIKRDRKTRLEWAERCGYGFDLPEDPTR